VNNIKPCESAYLAAAIHNEGGPHLHAAGMVDRTSGVTHYYLVRGAPTQSVVTELQRQLTKAGRIGRNGSRPGLAWAGAVLLTGLIAGLITTILGLGSTR